MRAQLDSCQAVSISTGCWSMHSSYALMLSRTGQNRHAEHTFYPCSRTSVGGRLTMPPDLRVKFPIYCFLTVKTAPPPHCTV